jgi:hypothetical protein
LNIAEMIVASAGASATGLLLAMRRPQAPVIRRVRGSQRERAARLDQAHAGLYKIRGELVSVGSLWWHDAAADPRANLVDDALQVVG